MWIISVGDVFGGRAYNTLHQHFEMKKMSLKGESRLLTVEPKGDGVMSYNDSVQQV